MSGAFMHGSGSRARRRATTPAAVRLLPRALLLGLALALLDDPGAAAQTGTASLDVQVADGRLSVDLDAGPLNEVLTAIADQTGAELVIRGDLGEVRPQAFQNEPLARGMRRLIGQNSMVMKFDPAAAPDAPPRLKRLMVYAADAIAADEAVVRAARRTARATAAGSGVPGSYDQIADLDLRARLRAVRDLARSGDEAALGTLAEILARDEDPQVRRAAVANLGRLGGPEASLLAQEGLVDGDPMVRIEAVRALASDADAAAPLARVLSDDPDATVRRVAVQILASLDSEEAQAILEIALDDADDAVRAAATNALER